MYYGVSIDISIIFLIIFSCCLMYKFLKKMFLFEDDNREIISAKQIFNLLLKQIFNKDGKSEIAQIIFLIEENK